MSNTTRDVRAQQQDKGKVAEVINEEVIFHAERWDGWKVEELLSFLFLKNEL